MSQASCIKASLYFFVLSLYCHSAHALDQCSAIFPSGVASNDFDGGFITINNGATIENSGGIIHFKATNINDSNTNISHHSCESADCSSSNQAASTLALPAFQSTSSFSYTGVTSGSTQNLSAGDYGTIQAFPNATVSFTQSNGTSRVNSLELQENATLLLSSGTYWFSSLNLREAANILPMSGAKVVIYANSVSIDDHSQINSNGNPEQLAIISYNSFTLGDDSVAKGYFYSANGVDLDKGSNVEGAINTKFLNIAEDVTLTYNASGIAELELGQLCAKPQKLVEYSFEQSPITAANSVLDSSGNGNHGSPIGAPETELITSGARTCRVLDIDDNSSQSAREAIDTGLDVDSDIGNTGTISFWYRSKERWGTGGRKQLIDGTGDEPSTSNDNYFFVSMSSDGEIIFGLEQIGDEDLYSNTVTEFSFAANEWVHIAVTWDALASELDIFINGINQATSDTKNLPNGAPLDDLGNLFIGDNSTDYSVFIGSTDNSANGQFDNLNVYNYIQSSAGIVADMNVSAECDLSDAYQHLTFEQVDISAANSILDNSGINNHASRTSSNITTVLPNPQKACMAVDVPNNTNTFSRWAVDSQVSVNDLGNGGTVSFWYKRNANWNNGVASALFDGSKIDYTFFGNIDGNDSHAFHLLLTSSGTLELALEDEDDDTNTIESASSFSFSAGEWVHLAATWDLDQGTSAIYVNGSVVAQTSSLGTNDDFDSSMPTIYIGDNREDSSDFYDSAFYTSSTGNSANGQFDDVRIYNFSQSQAQVATDRDNVTPCAMVDHYRIEHDGQGLTCEAESFTIKACADSSCSNVYDDNVSVQIGGIPGISTYSFNSTDSSADVLSFNQVEPGTLTFSLGSASPSAPLRCFVGATESCSIDFVNVGFQFFGTSPGTSLPDQTAEGNFSDVNLRAIRTDNNTGACVAAYTGSQSVNFDYTCVNPNACKTQLQQSGSGFASGSSINLTFDSSGVASLSTLSYPDAGQIQLTASDTINGASATGVGSLDVYPNQLRLTNQANSEHIAGEVFSWKVEALGLNGGVLQNYQPTNAEVRAQRLIPTDVGSVDGLLTLTTGTAFAVGTSQISQALGTSAFVNGELEYTDADYAEFGRIRFDVIDTNYLGNTISSSGPLERSFIPAYFDIAPVTLSLEDSCGSFSYIGQPLTFDDDSATTADDLTLQITARNAKGAITQNYSNSHWGLNLATAQLANISYADASSGLSMEKVTDGLVIPDITVRDTFNGQHNFTLSAQQFRYIKELAPIAPFSASISMLFPVSMFTDTSNNQDICYQADYINNPNVCSDFVIQSIVSPPTPPALTNLNMRWGRLVMENSHGPEGLDLYAGVRMEYYHSAAQEFVLNLADSCTNLNWVNAHFDSLTPMGDNDITGEINSISADFTFVNGRNPNNSGIRISAPSNGQRGQFVLPRLPFSAAERHLEFDWDLNHTNATIVPPQATISFGLFRGNDTTIYWRELY